MFSKQSVLSGHNGSIYFLERGSDKNFFSGGSDGLVVQWNLDSLQTGEVIAKSAGTIYSLCFIANQNILLVGNSSGGIHVIDLETKNEKRLLQYNKNGIFDLRFSIKNNLLIAASGEGVLTFCRLDDLSIIKQVQLCNSKIRAIDFDADEKQIAVGCGDGSIVIFDATSVEITNRFLSHKEDWSVNAVRFHPSGNYLLSASRDAMLNVYNVKNNFLLMESIPAHNYAIYDIQFSPDKKQFATASRDKSIKIWDAESLSFIQKLDKEKSGGHLNSVNKILWIDFETTLISAGDDRSIIVWKSDGGTVSSV